MISLYSYFFQFYCKINRNQLEIVVEANYGLHQYQSICWNIKFKISRKKPGDKAFWDSFKFPRRGRDQRLANFNGLSNIETRSCYTCLVLYLHGLSKREVFNS